MHTLHSLSETETPEAIPHASNLIKAVMAACVAIGIYDGYQEYMSYSSENPAPIVEVQP